MEQERIRSPRRSPSLAPSPRRSPSPTPSEEEMFENIKKYEELNAKTMQQRRLEESSKLYDNPENIVTVPIEQFMSNTIKVVVTNPSGVNKDSYDLLNIFVNKEMRQYIVDVQDFVMFSIFSFALGYPAEPKPSDYYGINVNVVDRNGGIRGYDFINTHIGYDGPLDAAYVAIDENSQLYNQIMDIVDTVLDIKGKTPNNNASTDTLDSIKDSELMDDVVNNENSTRPIENLTYGTTDYTSVTEEQFNSVFKYVEIVDENNVKSTLGSGVYYNEADNEYLIDFGEMTHSKGKKICNLVIITQIDGLLISVDLCNTGVKYDANTSHTLNPLLIVKGDPSYNRLRDYYQLKVLDMV